MKAIAFTDEKGKNFGGGNGMALNDRERKVLELIREDPFVSQQDLAQVIGLSRSTIANLLSNLVQKGYLLGKAYIINEEQPIVCIGAANMDDRYIVQEELIEKTSNNVRAASTLGGSARNVAENMGRLGEQVKLISVAGNDSKWKNIKDTSQHFMDLSDVTILEDNCTGSFTEIIDKDGELMIGLADMAIYEYLTLDRINKCLTSIQRAKSVVVDLNCPKETIEFLHAFTKRNKISMYLLTVSVQQMENMPSKLDGMSIITKHNETEAKYHLPAKTDEDLKAMAQMYINKGAKEVAISKDNSKIAYGNKEGIQIFENPRQNQNHYHWGLNEAFCGALIYARNNSQFASDPVAAGVVNAFETGESTRIVRTNLAPDQLRKEMEQASLNGDLQLKV